MASNRRKDGFMEYFVVMWQGRGETKPIKVCLTVQEAKEFICQSAFSLYIEKVEGTIPQP
jgi:hypothetical protein